MLIGVLLFSTLSAFAINTGDRISFTHRFASDGTTDVFKSSGGWEGTCAEMGKDSPSSGTATVTVLDRNSKITKIAYHYGYVKGWQNNMDSYKGWISTKGEVYSHLIRVAYMGFSDWESVYRSYGRGEAMIDEVRDLWNDVNSLSAAPANFKCIQCDQGSKQTFVMFRFAPTGKIKLNKNSSNSSITG